MLTHSENFTHRFFTSKGHEYAAIVRYENNYFVYDNIKANEPIAELVDYVEAYEFVRSNM